MTTTLRAWLGRHVSNRVSICVCLAAALVGGVAGSALGAAPYPRDYQTALIYSHLPVGSAGGASDHGVVLLVWDGAHYQRATTTMLAGVTTCARPGPVSTVTVDATAGGTAVLAGAAVNQVAVCIQNLGGGATSDQSIYCQFDGATSPTTANGWQIESGNSRCTPVSATAIPRCIGVALSALNVRAHACSSL